MATAFRISFAPLTPFTRNSRGVRVVGGIGRFVQISNRVDHAARVDPIFWSSAALVPYNRVSLGLHNGHATMPHSTNMERSNKVGTAAYERAHLAAEVAEQLGVVLGIHPASTVLIVNHLDEPHVTDVILGTCDRHIAGAPPVIPPKQTTGVSLRLCLDGNGALRVFRLKLQLSLIHI